MKWRDVGVVGCCVALLSVGVEGAELEEPFTRVRPYNLSSHLPEFFREVLKNRVWVYERNGSPAVMFLAEDGSVEGCWSRSSGLRFVKAHGSMRWRIGTPAGISNFETSWATPEGLKYYRMVLIYDGETGGLHGERFSTRDLSWYVSREGWLQEGWPAVFVEKCGEVSGIPEISVNAAQDTLDFEALRRNAKRVVEPPGWTRSFPGATGVGKSGGKPTLTLEEVLAHRAAGHGKVAIGMSGDRWVGVVWENYAELWKVDSEDEIVDMAITRRTPDGSVVLVRWEKSGMINSYHIGYPIPMVVTNRLHSSFEMMNQIGASKKPVTLTGSRGNRREHVFDREGGVRVSGAPGEWFISRGSIVVKTDTGEERYPWRDVAEASGWTRNAR